MLVRSLLQLHLRSPALTKAAPIQLDPASSPYHQVVTSEEYAARIAVNILASGASK